MSVAELKERHAAATETVNSLRERLKQKRLSLLDTDGMRLCLFFLSSNLLKKKFLAVLFWIFGIVRDLIDIWVWIFCSCRICEVSGEDPCHLWTYGSGLL